VLHGMMMLVWCVVTNLALERNPSLIVCHGANSRSGLPVGGTAKSVTGIDRKISIYIVMMCITRRQNAKKLKVFANLLDIELLKIVRFQVLTAASMMFRIVFWDVKIKQSRYTPWRRRGRGDIAPTHSRPRH